MKDEYTLEDFELTPEYIIKAKYNSVLQIVQARNSWEQKYPLLEKIIDGIINEKLKGIKRSCA